MAVEPESWLQMYPEFEVPEDQKKAWLADRTGAIIGADLGEAVRLEGRRPRAAAGADLPRVHDGRRGSSPSTASTTRRSKGVDKTQFFFHYDYLNEAMRKRTAGWRDQVGWYIFRVADPATSDQLAKKIDAMFANSPAETKTATEKAFISDWAKQVGDIGSIMIAITGVVMFFILFVAGNAMAQSIRERINELGVLKTLGFGDGRILALVLLESCTIAFLGGGLGLADRLDDHHRRRRSDRRDAADLPLPAARSGHRRRCWCSLLGLGTGMLPAFQASRLKIVDALRRSVSHELAVSDRRGHRRDPAIDSASGSGRRSWRSSASPAWSSCSRPCSRSPRASSAAMKGTGDPQTVIVLRSGSDTEMTSGFSGEEARLIIGSARHRARARTGRTPRPSCSSSSDIRSSGSGTDANVPLRGLTPIALKVRPQVKIVEGRMFTPGTNEIVVGRAASRQFAGLTIGTSVRWGEIDVAGRRHLRRGRQRRRIGDLVRRARCCSRRIGAATRISRSTRASSRRTVSRRSRTR